MIYNEGRALIAQMQQELNLTNWSTLDLITYITDKKQSGYLDILTDGVVIDGYFTLAELEAILTALYNERGNVMRG